MINISFWTFFLFLLGIGLIILWITTFVGMLTSRIKKEIKGIYTALFIIVPIITPFVWLIFKPKR